MGSTVGPPSIAWPGLALSDEIRHDTAVGGVGETTEQLARRVTAIPDAPMRVAYVRHVLGTMRPDDAATLVMVAATGAEAHEPAHAALMLAISLALAEPQADPLRKSIVGAAIAQGHAEVASLLGQREQTGGDAKPNAHVPDFGKGRPLTLGERKTLARRHDRDLLARVLRDPHPDVIRILLGNPALTEADVVRLCATRPVASDVLREVFRSPRWVVRYGVQKAIIKNPHTPLDVALQLATHLHAQDARDVAESPDLAEELRERCRRVSTGAALH